jgi:hypothetical protein
MPNSLVNNPNINKTESEVYGRILTVYLALKPLYFFSSGLPQISDMFLLLATVYLLFHVRGKIRIQKSILGWVTVFVFTLVFQCAIQLVWWLETDERELLLMPTYYIFNFIAALLCLCVGNRIGTERLKLVLCNGCFWSILVTALGLLVNWGTGARMKGFFNNPNQLGYYALLVATVIAFFPDQLPKWKKAVTLTISVLAIAFSLSKAAIVGLAGLTVCYFIWGSQKRTRRQMVIRAAILLLFFTAVYWLLFSDSSIIQGNQTLNSIRIRIRNMGSEKDSALGIGRGYNRVQELGMHFLWGMGEGAYERFQVLSGKEVHSTLINILVSYGAVGSLAYLWLIGRPLLRCGARLQNLACVSGVVLYSFTHNGIRNTLLWLLLAAVIQCNALDPAADRTNSEGQAYEA